jgi:hypothetical protein
MASKTTFKMRLQGGGQFAPETGGQFTPDLGGQVRPERGGQIERIFQRRQKRNLPCYISPYSFLWWR